MSRLVLILIIAFSTSLLSGKNNGSIQNRIDEILRTIPYNTKYGVMVYNPITKDTLYKRNIYEPIKPASNTKLFTTGAAFSLLGGDYQLSTKFFTDDDNLSDGVINGNLYIKGFGHSLFTDRDMDAMVGQLVSMGIHKITGRVIGDDSYFDDMYHRRDWIEEETNDALPPVSAIVINRNRIQFNLEASSRVGGLINFNFTPYCSLIKVRVNARTARGRSGITILQNYSATGYEFVINGSLKRRSRMLYYSAEIKNPPLFAAFLLQDKLNRQGISVAQRPSKGETPENLHEIVSRAITLRDLSKIINKHSDNFLAECLFKTVGAAFSHNQGNSFYATQAISDFLKRNSIYSEGTSINDGSGLSHSNRVTVGGIVNLLEKMYYNPLVFTDYYNSLSIAGTDGTLRNRMIGTAAENSFHGKTGTLNGVIALSGYLTIKGKQDLIVSIIFEYEKGSPYRYRFLEDQIITSLAQDNSIVQQGLPEEKNQ